MPPGRVGQPRRAGFQFGGPTSCCLRRKSLASASRPNDPLPPSQPLLDTPRDARGTLTHAPESSGANRDRTGDLLLAKRHGGPAVSPDFPAFMRVCGPCAVPRIRRDQARLGWVWAAESGCCPDDRGSHGPASTGALTPVSSPEAGQGPGVMLVRRPAMARHKPARPTVGAGDTRPQLGAERLEPRVDLDRFFVGLR
jgi:hypothetical protein